MLNIQPNDNLPPVLKQSIDEYFSNQLHLLLTTCHCSFVSGKDYEIEIASQSVMGLVNDNETADVHLYAAIERQDWDEVMNIYKMVFRPYILQSAHRALSNAFYS